MLALKFPTCIQVSYHCRQIKVKVVQLGYSLESWIRRRNAQVTVNTSWGLLRGLHSGKTKTVRMNELMYVP